MKADLLDVNVWVALSVLEHPLYERAHVYWREESAGNLAFYRTTALGMVRVCCLKSTLGGVPLTAKEAWGEYRRLREEEWVALLDEPAGVDVLLDHWASAGLITPRTWTDAYLAAFAVGSGSRMISFDSDFHRYPGLDFLHLVA